MRQVTISLDALQEAAAQRELATYNASGGPFGVPEQPMTFDAYVEMRVQHFFRGLSHRHELQDIEDEVRRRPPAVPVPDR